MIKQTYVATSLCIVIILSFSLLPTTARGGERNSDKPLRLYATASVGVIGKVAAIALEPGAFTINGRAAVADQSVWEGDLLRSHSDIKVPIRLDMIGNITLTKGTAVRLATAASRLDENGSGRLLVASLSEGEIAVALDRGVTASLFASGSAFTASPGASFRLAINAGRATAVVKAGSVAAEAQSVQRHNLQPVGHGSEITVRTGGLRYIRVQVTDSNDKPMAEMPVQFSLGSTGGRSIGLLGLGTLAGLTYNTITNEKGIASVPFNAGRVPGITSITAVVEASGVSWSGNIRVESGPSAGKGALWVAVVAAGIGVAVAAVKLSNENDPIRTLPPQTTP